jgi:hypothetical protein
MFEKASRLKVRFNHKGLCSAEDLWDLPLKALDSIFKALNAQNKTQKEESLLETRSQEDDLLALQIAIVKHVVEVRLQEQRAREDVATKAAQKQKLLGIISKKQDEQLENMSVEDLTKLVANL